MRSCVQIFDLYGIYTGCTWVVLGMMISPPRDLMSCLPLAIPFVVSHQSLVVIAVENIRSFTEGSVITVEKEERGGGEHTLWGRLALIVCLWDVVLLSLTCCFLSIM